MLIHGQRLCLAQGYTATTVDAVCEAAGVTKGSFFHHFKTKDDFGAQLLRHTWHPVEQAYATEESERDIGKRLADHIRFMADWIADGGRLIPLMAQELGASNEAVRSQIGGYFGMWTSKLSELLGEAADQTGSDVDIEGLREFIIATTEGVPVAKSQFGPQAMSNVSVRLVRAVLIEVGLQET